MSCSHQLFRCTLFRMPKRCHEPANQGRLFESHFWSVMLPDSWCGNEDGLCATLTREQPLGALQLSAARKDAGPVLEDDLREFASDTLSLSAELRHIDYGCLRGLMAEEVRAG